MRCEKCEELEETVRQLREDLLGTSLVDRFRASLRIWRSEASVLAYLYKRYPNPVPMAAISSYLFPEVSEKNIDVRVYRLRNVLGENSIQTIQGMRALTPIGKGLCDKILAGEKVNINRSIRRRSLGVEKILTYLSTKNHAEASVLLALSPGTRLSYLYSKGWIEHLGKKRQGLPGVYAITPAGLLHLKETHNAKSS